MFGGDIRSRIIRSTRYKNNITSLINTIDVLDVRTFKSLKQKNEAIIYNTIGRAERLLDYYDRVFGEFRSARHLAALEGTAKSVEETATRNARIEDLQLTAELVLLFALVPYYIGSNLSNTENALIPLLFDSYEYKLFVADTVVWLFAGALGVWLGVGWFAKYKPRTEGGALAKRTQDAIKRWFKLFLRPSVAGTLGVILFAVFWAYAVIHFQIPERFPG